MTDAEQLTFVQRLKGELHLPILRRISAANNASAGALMASRPGPGEPSGFLVVLGRASSWCRAGPSVCEAGPCVGLSNC